MAGVVGCLQEGLGDHVVAADAQRAGAGTPDVRRFNPLPAAPVERHAGHELVLRHALGGDGLHRGVEVEPRARGILVVVERRIEPGARAAAVEVVGHHVGPVEDPRHVGVLERIDASRAGGCRNRQQPVRANRLANRGEQQDVVAGVARVSGLKPAGYRVLPVDVDAVELRVGLQEAGARLREHLARRLRRGHLVERSRVGPPAHRQQELQVRMAALDERDLVEQPVRTARLGTVAGIHLFDGGTGVPRQAVVRADLGEGVVDVGQPVPRGCRRADTSRRSSPRSSR